LFCADERTDFQQRAATARIKVEASQTGSEIGMQSGADQPVVAEKLWKHSGAKELAYAIGSNYNNLKKKVGEDYEH